MRCPSCAAFVDDDATSCTSCGSEVSFEPPPPPPPEALAPDPAAEIDRGGDGGSGGYMPPPPAPPSSGGSDTCDSCRGTFSAMQLTRIHSQRLCAECAAKTEERGVRPSSGRMPSPSGAQAKPVSRMPLVFMGLVVVGLAGVAIYFTVFGKKIENLGSTAPTTTTPVKTAGPGPGTAPIHAPPPPPERPEDLKFVGVLQPFEKDASGEPVYLAFVSDDDGREIRVTGVDKYLAEDFQVGKAYRISYRAVPNTDKLQEIKYTLKTKIEPAN